MQHSSVSEPVQLRGSWSTLLNRLCEDPRVSQLMNTTAGQYLSSHPVLAQTLLLFSVFAVLPVGLFLTLAVVTFIMSAVGFIFFQVCLLFVGALSLLGVLFGIALFSLVASLIFNMFFLTISNILQLPRLTSLAKKGDVQGKESNTSRRDETQ